jgi:hypothetical protein
VVVTLRRCEESRRAPSTRVARACPGEQTPSGVAPIATKKRASKCTPERPLAVEPGPVTATGSRAGAGGPVGLALELTPRKWCPLHETSHHDVTACLYIGHLVEIRGERLAKRVAKGVTHNCYECGQAGQWLGDCPGKVPLLEGPGSQGRGLAGAQPRAPQDRGRRSAATGGLGRRVEGHLGML